MTQSDFSPSHTWGIGSPLAILPPDGFSARWTTIQNLTGGTYEVSAIADDGVRVYINGFPVIDEWHLASGQRYVRTVNLATGPASIQVDYFENTGLAAINFALRQIDTNPVQPAVPQATITAQTLNVRD